MEQLLRFDANGQDIEVPRTKINEFMQDATEHAATPDEIHSLRVTTQSGKAQDVEVPQSQMEAFKEEANENGATFTPLRTVEMANGTRKTMTVGELSKFLRSKEYLESEDHKASVQQQEENGLTQGSVGLAGTIGAVEGLVKGGWYGGNAVANKIAKAIPEVGVEIEKAIGNLAKGAGNLAGSDAVHDVGDWLVRGADDAKVWLDKNLPSETAEWSGYSDWSTKVADKIGEVAAMAYKFAPGLAPKAGGTVLEKALAGGNNKLMETIFASDGVNAYAQTYDTALENGSTPTQAAAEGGAAFLINYFGQKAMIKAGGIVEGVKNPALRFAGGAAATGDAMGVLGSENKALQNIAENKPVGEGVGEAFAEGTVEGVLFHSMNAVPVIVMGAMKSRADRKMYDEIARTEILEALKRPEGSAALAGLMDKEAGDAAIAAYKDSSSAARTSGVEGPKREEVRRLAIEAGLPETMTTAEMYRVLDAVAQQRQALAERVRTQMSDEQADALAQAVEAEIVKGVEPGQPAPTGKEAEELFQRTWLRTVEKIQDAAVLDDPEMKKSLVETARKQAASEIRNERESEAQELSRIRGASLGDQLAEFEKRGIATWEDAEADGLIGKDERGRWAGGARQALNIELHGTEKMKDAVKEGKLDGDLAEELITASYLDLGGRPPEERAAMIDRIIDQADGNTAEARRLLSEVSPNAVRTSGLPETAYEGAVNAERMKGTELKTIDGGVMGVQRFPEVRVEINADGITVEGLTDELMSKPENTADVAALLTRLNDIAERNNLTVDLGDANAKAIADGMIDEISRGGLEATQRKMDTRARLFKVLADTTLGNGTTFDEQSFRTALAETGNGRRWVDNHGNIYGFVDDKGVIHFNPATFSMNTPIHEYGHVALEAVKRINPKLWEKGMELIEGTAYLDEIERYSKTDGHEYSYLRGNREAMKDEALATMIGDRGEKLVVERGLEAKLKEWIKEVWKAFKEAFGVADLTDEQIEKMSIDDFVNVMNAELLRGREFGLKNRRNSTLNRKPLTKARSFEQHYQMQEEQEQAAEAERWANSGMNAMDYILSRVEEGEPAFDLDWETAREIALDRAQGRFSIGGLYTGSVKDGDTAGWNYVSFRDDNIRVDHKWRDGQAVFQAGAAPKLNKSRFIAGRARIAADAEMNERTPGAIAASRELNTWRTRPVSQLGAQRYMSLPIADLEQLRKAVTGQTLPAIVMKNMAGGRLASHTRDGQLIIAADVFGTVDKADMEAEKTTLKAHGFFRNEDPNWCAGQLPGDILREQRRSEDQLATQLLQLGSRRARGQASGGQEGARGVFADEVASIILEQPRQYGGVLGRIQTLGKGVKDAARAILGSNDRAKQEAGAFLDWAYGGQLVDPATGNPIGRADALTLDQLTSSMFGKWLVMPMEVETRAPGWSQVFESTIANDKKLSEVFRTLFDQHLQKNDYILRKLKEQQSIETQQAIAQIEQKSDEPISAGSWWKDFKESTLFGLHDRMSPVYLRINDKYRIQIKAMREAIKTASPKDRQALKQSLQLFMGRYGDVMNKLEISRTAYERGGLNQDSIYAREMARLENDAYEKWALSSEDRSLYLDQKRVIETQGRASSFGEDVRTAQMVLDEMKQRLGPQKWAKMEEYGRRFHDIHERYFLDDERAERMWGKALIDYFRSQSDYVTTDRVFSREELDAIKAAGELAKASGVAGNDDVVSQFYTYAGAKGAGEAIGEAGWNGKLSGSFAGKKEVIGATYEKVDRLKRSLRRNQLILDLREALMFAKVDGVRDLPAEKAGDFPAGKRYGHLTYFENGKKRVLVVPKQIEDGFGFEGQNKWYLKTVNAINRGWRALVIDFNPAYWPMNIRRNQQSIEKNMPGMRETWVKTALRAVSPGLGSASDIVNQALVRNIPAAAKLFSEHTMFFYIPQMERICKIVENMSKWQREYWNAEATGDLAKIQQMNEDWKWAKRMLDANIFVSVKNAYDGNVSQGFAADALAKKGIKTLEQIDNEMRAKSGMRKILDKIDILHKNQNLQNHEDILAKGCAFLADARLYELKRTDAERGALVNSRVSIAQGERRGAAANFMKNIVPFYNMIEKGVVRHGKAMMEDPKHTLIQDSKSIFGRVTSMMFATGVVQYLLLKSEDGDEKKAQERYGLLYDYAKAYKTAYQNCSNYIRKNYNITPIWNSGFTSVVLGGAMTDEDKLLAPISDFIANTAAYQSGLAAKPSFGSTILDSTVGAVVPDLALTGPIIEGLEVAISAVGGKNPFDYFRDAKKFDQKILDNRFESWEGFKDFAAVAGADLWNYFGGRAIVPANVNGVDNGRGKAPDTLEAVLRDIPYISPVFNRMVKIQVGSPTKRGQPITEAKSKKDALIERLAASFLDLSDEQVPYNEKDPEGYQKKIEQWKADYNLSDYDTAMIKMNFFNAFNARKCQEALDQRKLQNLMIEGRKQGKSKSQMWVIFGNM